MTTNTTQPTRRAMIAALAMAVPAGALATTHKVGATGMSPELAEAFRLCRAAREAQERFDPIESAARDRYHAAVDALPHYTASFANMGGDTTTLTTAEPRLVKLATTLSRGVATDPKGNPRSFADRAAMKQEDYMQASRHVVAGAKKRERQMGRIAKATGLDAANAESNRLSDLYAEAETAVYEAPVASLTDLKAKLDFMVETDAFDLAGTPERLAADVASLVAREA